MKNHHISEGGVSFEIQFSLFITIWAGEHMFYIWQKTIALIEQRTQLLCIETLQRLTQFLPSENDPVKYL